MSREHIKDQLAKGTWLTYRPEIKIMDCTIRDGGLINDHQFEDGFVKAVYQDLRGRRDRRDGVRLQGRQEDIRAVAARQVEVLR